MYKRTLLLFFSLCFIIIGCKEEKKIEDKEVYWEMITIRTLGLAYLEENKLAEAEEEFKKLIELVPEEPLGYANLGLVYLRMGKYAEAEEQLKQAVDRNPNDPDIRLILAKVYEVSDQSDASFEELNRILDISPRYVKALYNLAELYSRSSDKNSLQQRQMYLSEVVENVPANIVPRLQLIEVQVQIGEFESALAQLEEIKQIMPQFPPDADEFYQSAQNQIKANNEQAYTQVLIFHNFLKLTSLYQMGVQELKGPGGPLVGFPVITFDETSLPAPVNEQVSIVEAIRFTDVTASAGLGDVGTQGNISIADFDGDGDVDIFYGNGSGAMILNNELGKFTDYTEGSGISIGGNVSTSRFADINNDGHLDLYVSTGHGNMLYQNTTDGRFEDVSAASKLSDSGRNNYALFFDMDHEGDLDLFMANTGRNGLFQNNLDGSFSDLSAKLPGNESNSRDTGFSDFDDDGDIDFIVINNDASNVLYTNLREGNFKDITSETGLPDVVGSTAVAIGDYNNDGYSDLFIAGTSGKVHALYRNNKEGIFEKEDRTDFSELAQVEGNDVAFLDFDNDGFLDIILAGKQGVFLFHNEAEGVFKDVSHILPEYVNSGKQLAFGDYNQDGDIDIFMLGNDGKPYLLRNDGGNANHYLKIQLVGLKTGSGKNNHFGIGAKLEVRAGDLYQMKIVSEPIVYLGLGHRTNADVVRILWTNGVPQNLFTPRTDQDLIEEQVLKGSCPFLYTWNGEEFVFVKDMMWRSALGMPMGIMGGNTTYAFPNASEEYIKVPGELLLPKDGKLMLKITAELWETIYFDKLSLVVIDHPDSNMIFVDERFTPPPFPGMELFVTSDTQTPASATDENDQDVLPFILEKDNVYISDFTHTRFQGVIDTKDLVLEPDSDNAFLLFLNGWIFPTDASINKSISQSSMVKVVAPYLQVINNRGEWQTVIENIGFPMGKNKTVIVDLSGKYLSNDRRIRIRTNMEIYWDHVFFGTPEKSYIQKIQRLEPLKSDLHYRGFSKMYRKGSNGPHWFDYKETTTGQLWRDLDGDYTRYGEVNELITQADSRYIIMNAGDEVSVEFDTANLPELRNGWKRDFFLFSVGWVKDGDMNTATGNEVLPLPFHGMSQYPYNDNQKFTDDPDLNSYNDSFNTREVNAKSFKESIIYFNEN